MNLINLYIDPWNAIIVKPVTMKWRPINLNWPLEDYTHWDAIGYSLSIFLI